MPEMRTTRVTTTTTVGGGSRSGMDFRTRYCCSIPGILKWLEIIVCCVILGLLYAENIREGRSGYSLMVEAEHYTGVVAVVCLVITCLLLLIFFLNCHHGPMASCQCHNVAYVFFILACLAFLAAGGVETWVTVKYKSYRGSYYSNFYERRAAAAAMCFLNAILYFLSLHQAKYVDL